MNFGRGTHPATSGELYVMKMISSDKESGRRVVLDVGANIGKYSVALSKHFAGDDHVIHSFEPSPLTFEQLKKNVADLRAVQVHNVALSDHEGDQTLFSRSPLSGMSSLYQRRLEHFNMQMDRTETIHTTTLDSFAAEHEIDSIHFLKMDIEGHELSCLSGATQFMQKNRIKYIQFEFGGCNIDSRTYFQDFWYLLSPGYKLFRIVQDGLVEIKAYNERLEIFKNINYLAIRKADV